MGCNGSITIEACIAFPLFISIFLLMLLLMKISCISIVLDQAVSETAKQIAAEAYPITYLNEYEDEFQGETERTEDNDLLQLINRSIRAEFLRYIPESVTGSFSNAETRYETIIAAGILNEFTEGTLVNKEKLKIRIAEFPQSNSEYENKKASGIYKDIGLIADRDFNKDDIVIQIEYDCGISIPYFENTNIILVFTAVEKAWLNTSQRIAAESKEGLKLDNDDSIIYITRFGEKYHKEQCFHLRKSKIPICLKEAIKEGYLPCKHCKP